MSDSVTIKASIRKLIGIKQSYAALHAMVRPLKNNAEGQVVPVPFALAGTARRTLNENSAALLRIIEPHDDAVNVLRKQKREEMEAEQEAIKDANPADDEERDRLLARCEADYNRKLNNEVEAMLEDEREVELAVIVRASLNEDTNAFFPDAFALLLNRGLISGGAVAAKSKAA